MDYDDNFNKAFQDHDLLETSSNGSATKNKVIPVEFDKFCHVVKRKFVRPPQQPNGRPPRKLRKQDKYLTMYSSGLPGTNIRDAVTGAYYQELVGSAWQDMFFKATIATGEFANGPLHLFYLSPEQYERHQECELDEYIKAHWFAKREVARAKLGV